MLALAALAALWGCTATGPRPTAEINRLRAEAPPEMQSLINPVRGKKFADTWQAARSGGRRHEGVDIFAKKGTNVRSTTDGIVTKAGKNRLGGKVIGIQGPGAWHYYAHLSSRRVKLYERVKAGQVIGEVGKTGNAKNTPAHLHYGVYLPDGAVNPFPLIRQDD
ncbi:M23 family metallopeptidase [Neisseria chenwenguii]